MSQRSARPIRSAEAALDRLEKLYADASSALVAALDRYLATREPPSLETRAQFRYPLLRIVHRDAARTLPEPPARLRPAAKPRRLRDDDHPSRRLPPLPAGAAHPADRRVRRPHRDRRQRPGDPLPLCARARRRDCRRRRHLGRSRPPFPDAAALRRGRRDRRRPVGASRRPATPAVAVRCRPRRLLAAPPRALHGQRLAQRAAMDPAHQLSPLRRPVRALGPRAARSRRHLSPRRAARQHIDRPGAIPARRPTPWSPPANGTATRCRPITWSPPRAKA